MKSPAAPADETDANAATPWRHELPTLPRWYILFLAAVANFVFLTDQDLRQNISAAGPFLGLRQTLQDDLLQFPLQLGDWGNPLFNLLFFALLLYLNYQVIHMFLAKLFHK